MSEDCTRERVQQRTVVAPIRQTRKQTVEADEVAPHERVQQRIVEAPMPQILKETVEMKGSRATGYGPEGTDSIQNSTTISRPLLP